MSKSAKKSRFSFILPIIALILIALSAIYLSSRVKNKNTVEKSASAASYNINLTAMGTYTGGNYGIKADWQPATNDTNSSLFIWNGDTCKSAASGYGPGELVWSYPTTTKTTYTHANVGYQPGNKYCVQIWTDFYAGVAGSNPAVIQIPMFSASAVVPSTSNGSYAIKTDWQPPTNDTNSSLFIWNGDTCKSAASGYGPGELIWSQPTNTKTTYTNTSVGYKPGNKYCVQIWNDFYKGIAYTKPFTVQIPLPSCSVTISPSNASVKRNKTLSLEAKVIVANGFVSKVDFTSSDTSIAKINPTTDSSSPYVTILTAQSKAGKTNVAAKVNLYFSGQAYSCSATSAVIVGN
jgi:hypothetical protein